MSSNLRCTSRAVSLAVLLMGVGATVVATLRPVVAASAETLTGTGPPDSEAVAMLVLVSAAGAVLTWGWLLLCLLACLDDLRGAPSVGWRLGTVTALQPRVVHCFVRRLVGAAAVPALLTPAVAGPAGLVGTAGPWVPVAREQPSLPTSLSGLPLPDRVTGTGGLPGLPRTYRVRVGDTLWGIAARLAPGSPDVVVDRSWRRLYLVNRAAVGSDPDLIRPGTLLRLPGRAAPSS